MNFLQALVAVLRLGRPLFLVGGFLLHGLGVAIACSQGYRVQPWLLLWGQVAVTATQLMTHYGNDYFDLAADRANLTPTWWSGGSRVLVQTTLSPRWALYLALTLLTIALVAILQASRAAAPVALVVLVLGVILSWFYSAPPLRLHSRGVGELTVAVVVTLLVPLAGYALQAGRLATLPLLAVLPLALLQFAMLLAIGFPDEAGDAAVGKRTLVVRLGPGRAAQLWRLVLVLAVLVLPVLLLGGVPVLVVTWLAAFMLPAQLWFWWRLAQGVWLEPRWWSWLAFFSVAFLIGAAAVELAAFLSLCR
ncbi:MAG: prenyltransferase [Anaerolineae bacterium]|nr:prenyltransferase [Anaerolineae bacterium]